MQALRRLLQDHGEVVKEFEEVTGRQVTDELLWRWARAKGGAEQAVNPFLQHAHWRVQSGVLDEVGHLQYLQSSPP